MNQGKMVFAQFIEFASDDIFKRCVDLCLNVFCWAKFRSTKAAVKLHTLLDLKTSIPEYIFITDVSIHEVNILDYISLPGGSFLIMDRGYVDLKHLWRLAGEHINFVIRAKENMQYRVLNQGKTDRKSGVICDQCIELTNKASIEKYPGPLRRIHYYDAQTCNTLIFITNNFKLTALTIAALYKYR